MPIAACLSHEPRLLTLAHAHLLVLEAFMPCKQAKLIPASRVFSCRGLAVDESCPVIRWTSLSWARTTASRHWSLSAHKDGVAVSRSERAARLQIRLCVVKKCLCETHWRSAQTANASELAFSSKTRGNEHSFSQDKPTTKRVLWSVGEPRSDQSSCRRQSSSCGMLPYEDTNKRRRPKTQRVLARIYNNNTNG